MGFFSMKRAAAALLAFAVAIPLALLCAGAEENEGWLYIDGENITRTVNSAVIYRGIPSTGQSQWGANAVIDAEGRVASVYEGGDAAGADLAVPEGGAVVSVSGSKTQWLRDNLLQGRYVYYDGVTRRLFAARSKKDINPYFEATAEVAGEKDEYRLAEPEGNGDPLITYSVALNKKGEIIARGTNVEKPEDGSVISAHGEAGMRFLVTSAPLGAQCTVKDGVATVKYTEKMLGRTLELATAEAEARTEAAKAAFADADHGAAQAILDAVKEIANGKPDYQTVFDAVYELENTLPALLADRRIYELRAAIHTPAETNAAEVAAVVSRAAEAGLNRIILRMSNGYGTFLKMPEGSRFTQDEKFGGFDVLGSYIESCRRAGISLEVCAEVYYNEYAAVAEPGWTTVSPGGETGLSKKFFSPASREFAEYYVDYIKYLVTHYDIDGLMLDWLRYPKFSEETDLGYDEQTLAEFAEKSGISAADAETLKTELFSHPKWTEWVEFRSGLVTGLLESISEAVREARPDINITAVAGRDNVPHYYMQDVSGWLTNKLADGICLAFFEGDGEENDAISPAEHESGIVAEKCRLPAAFAGNEAYFYAGLDSGAAIDRSVLEREILDVRALNADGVVFSDLNALIAQNYASALKTGLFEKPSVAPGDDPASCATDILNYAKTKINGVITELGGCDEEAAAQAFSAINDAMSTIGEKGIPAERAERLESEIAMIFSRSEAKSAVLKEFSALSKLARLSKEPAEFIPPDDTDESGEDSSEEPPEESSEPDEESISGHESESEEPPHAGVSAGRILAFVFVGLTFAAAAAAAVTGIIRRRRKADRTGMYSSRLNEGGESPAAQEDAADGASGGEESEEDGGEESEDGE